MATLIRNVDGIVQVNVEDQGWVTIPQAHYSLEVSQDQTIIALVSVNNLKQEIPKTLVSNVLDADNGNTPFTAETLNQYLIDLGFFLNGSGGGPVTIPPGYGAGVKLSVYNTDVIPLDNETKVLPLGQPDPADPPYNCVVGGVNDSEIEILTEGYVQAAIEVHIEQSSGFLQKVYFHIEGLPPAPLPQVWTPIPDTGRVFNFISFTEGTKIFNFGGYVNAGSKFRIIAFTTDDVDFTPEPIPNTSIVSPSIALSVW